MTLKQVCWVPDQLIYDEKLGGQGASIVLSSLLDFNPQHFQLPAFTTVNGQLAEEIIDETDLA